MSLKLSAGCECCDGGTCAVCAASPPAEFDVTLYGFSDDFSGRCSGCENLDDTYTLLHEATPTDDYDCSWKYEASEYSGDHYADCDAGVRLLFIHQIILGLTRTVIGLQTRFEWQLVINSNGDSVTDIWQSWHREYLIWESGEPTTTSCNLSHTFEDLDAAISNVPLCAAIDGFTTAEVEVG